MALVIVSLILIFNFRMYLGPNLSAKNELEKATVLQLNYLENEIKNNQMADKMQQLFPEGAIFTHVLYGLTWAELAYQQNNTALKKRALQEAIYAYNQINTAEASMIFPKELELEYGVFYQGWKNYLLGKILRADNNISTQLRLDFTRNCTLIAHGFKNSNTPFLTSYSNQSWPADNFLAIASLKQSDELYPKQYQNLIADWIKKVKQLVDSETGLIPHKTNPIDGTTLEGSRGSSISLILLILAEIDTDFAQEQMKLYEKEFCFNICGLPAVREYPKGLVGDGDVDSGPVIFGMGTAATIVGFGTLNANGKAQKAQLLSNTIESFGFGWKSKENKKYVFGYFPIADAFIAWTRLANSPITNKKMGPVIAWQFHIYSALIIGITTLAFCKLK